MKYSILSCILAILASTSHVLAEGAEPIKADSEPTPHPGTPSEPDTDLKRRQGAPVIRPAATQNPLQVPPVTTYNMVTEVGGTETWMGFPYTQTFAPVPDQLPQPGVGSIGLGTHKKDKREAMPEETGLADSIVLELQTEVVTHFLRPITEMVVLETVTIMPNGSFYNGSWHGNGTYNHTNGTGHGLGWRNYTLPTYIRQNETVY